MRKTSPFLLATCGTVLLICLPLSLIFGRLFGLYARQIDPIKGTLPGYLISYGPPVLCFGLAIYGGTAWSRSRWMARYGSAPSLLWPGIIAVAIVQVALLMVMLEISRIVVPLVVLRGVIVVRAFQAAGSLWPAPWLLAPFWAFLLNPEVALPLVAVSAASLHLLQLRRKKEPSLA